MVALALPGFAAGLNVSAVTGKPVYERDILPLFRARCQACHSDAQPRAGFSFTTRQDLLEGGHAGTALVPGAPEKSLLYKKLADGTMPPGGPHFTPTELKLVERWIRTGAAGASGGGHWAFHPPVEPKLPVVKNVARVRNPLDRFLLSDLEQKGLTFAPEADRSTLLRRVTYDLVGEPPAPAEQAAFLADQSPNAYETVVERLLADPRYGERWARYWLDTAGYADSEGVLQEDRLRPNAWRYRDYVIRALNADKPYDQFLKEQLAGDELVDFRHAQKFTPEVIDTLAATGFLRTAVDATRPDFNAHQYGEYQYHMLHDTETIVASTVLGLTVQCSRCHDHKYEPLTQRDYYRVQALFAGAVRPRGKLLPTMERQILAATPAEQMQAKKTNAAVDAALAQLTVRAAAELWQFQVHHLETQISKIPEPERVTVQAAAQVEPGKRSPTQKALVEKYRALAEAPAAELGRLYPDFRAGEAKLQSQREAEEAKRVSFPEIRALYDQDAAPPPTPILLRGDWLHPGDAVEPGVPAELDDPAHPFQVPPPAAGAQSTGRRLAFAEWLTRPEHPLTARVIVNRLWAHHFGVGIVPTVENFGRSGARPSNRALLDWLALRLVQGVPATEGVPAGKPWSLKSIHRLIVTSAAYRQGSAWRPAAGKVDPDDRLLWRQRPHRLEAEAIRDGILAAAGTLDPTMFGPSVGLTEPAAGDVLPAGEEQKARRSLYLLVRRTQPVTFLNDFDAPVMEVNCTRRNPSITATQALALMNGRFLAAQSQKMARRVLRQQPPAHGEQQPADAATIALAYRLALSRPPTAAESRRAMEFISAQVQRYEPKSTPQEALEAVYADLCQALLSCNEFVYVD